jgi:hypothetical protein
MTTATNAADQDELRCGTSYRYELWLSGHTDPNYCPVRVDCLTLEGVKSRLAESRPAYPVRDVIRVATIRERIEV